MSDSFDDVIMYTTFQRREIYLICKEVLFKFNIHILWLLTFINALLSSPVHCLKLRPLGKWRSPVKWGIQAILFVKLWVITKHRWWEKNYRRSISSINSLATLAEALLRLIQSPTQSTKWSLNDPFMSWCRRLGESNSWMLAKGKSYVNG